MSGPIALAFFALGVITRLPFATQDLWAHDSVLYARAIEHFDPGSHRPQAPGYLYYVLLLRAVASLTGDANRAMVLVSAVAGGVAVALLYLLAARVYDERTARLAALFLLTAVPFWAYGAVAYPYTLLAALTIACALLFWRAVAGADATARGWRLLVASAAWGLAIGFRADLAIFLIPLWLLAAVRVPLVLSAACAGAVIGLTAVWFAATAAASGGAEAFLDALRAQAAFVDLSHSVASNGLEGLRRNAYDLARYLGRALYGLAPLVAAAALWPPARRLEGRDPRRALFVASWALAPVPVYLLVHVGEYGYVFSMLPALCLAAARGAQALARSSRRPSTLPALAAAAVAAHATLFLLSTTPLSAQDLARRDHGLSDKVAYVRGTFDPSETLVVTAYDALLVEHYLRGSYPTLAYDPAATPDLERSLACPSPSPCSPQVTVVAWDDLMRTTGDQWRAIPLAHGAPLRMARVGRDASLRVREGLVLQIVR